jgi:hypothetical protein
MGLEHRRYFLLVVLGVLSPFQLGFVNISVTVSDGGAKHFVREASSFEKRDHLGAQLVGHGVHSFEEVLVAALVEEATAV